MTAHLSAIISDVDGTLVNSRKELTAGAEKAVAALQAAGLRFSIISGRPPRGMRMLTDRLKITTPICGFNGGIVSGPGGEILSSHLLTSEIAREAVAILNSRGVDAWLFTESEWLLQNTANDHMERERQTLQFDATVVADFTPGFKHAYKVVGVSDDPDLLARCQAEIGNKFAGKASAVCSQPYYLDITHHLANKGEGIARVAEHLGVPLAEVGVLGDAANDIAMFRRAGFSVAMGNAHADVQKAANAVTESNDSEGFAKAVTRFILPDGPRPSSKLVELS